MARWCVCMLVLILINQSVDGKVKLRSLFPAKKSNINKHVFSKSSASWNNAVLKAPNTVRLETNKQTADRFSDIDNVINQLFEDVGKLQVNETKTPKPPFQWAEQKGVYRSDIKLNFHGKPELAVMRDTFSVFDNNMFATAWITICLLESFKYGAGPKPADQQLRIALDAIGQYHDRNLNYSNSIMSFWPQKYNDTAKEWQSTPENMLMLMDLTDKLPVKAIEEVLKLLGFKNVEKLLEELLEQK
jgi:hypothetical protein